MRSARAPPHPQSPCQGTDSPATSLLPSLPAPGSWPRGGGTRISPRYSQYWKLYRVVTLQVQKKGDACTSMAPVSIKFLRMM